MSFMNRPAMRRRRHTFAALLIGCIGVGLQGRLTLAQAPNPFLPPQAKAQYERSRDYHVRNILLHLKLDWSKKTFAGSVTHTLAPLRDRLAVVTFDVGPELQVIRCSIDGRPMKFDQTREKLSIYTEDHPLARDREIRVTIVYSSKPPEYGRKSLNGSYGFHWILPDRFQ